MQIPSCADQSKKSNHTQHFFLRSNAASCVVCRCGRASGPGAGANANLLFPEAAVGRPFWGSGVVGFCIVLEYIIFLSVSHSQPSASLSIHSQPLARLMIAPHLRWARRHRMNAIPGVSVTRTGDHTIEAQALWDGGSATPP